MKNNILKTIVLFLVFVIAVTGCGKKDEPQAIVPAETTEGTKATEPVVETTEGLVEISDGIGIWYGEPETVPAESAAPGETKSEEESAQPTEGPAETEPAENVPDETVDTCEYQQYMAMSPSEQQSYYETFGSPDAFFAWFTAAQQEHESHRNVTVIEGDANIDLSEFVNEN